jgi:hypothetical protein
MFLGLFWPIFKRNLIMTSRNSELLLNYFMTLDFPSFNISRISPAVVQNNTPLVNKILRLTQNAPNAQRDNN